MDQISESFMHALHFNACLLMKSFLCVFQIDALVVISPRQTAELIVEDFPGLPEKSVIINMVFDHILVSPEDRGLLEMLGYLIVLAGEVRLSYCGEIPVHAV